MTYQANVWTRRLGWGVSCVVMAVGMCSWAGTLHAATDSLSTAASVEAANKTTAGQAMQVVAETNASAPAIVVEDDTQQVQATVMEVLGKVQARSSADQPWEAVQVGQVLDVNSELRTGPFSIVQFQIPPGQRITLDRLGTVKIINALYSKKNKQGKTDLGVSYGRVRYDVKAAGVKHDSVVHTPGSTLALRGTTVFSQHDALFGTKMTSYGGKVFSTTDAGSGSWGDEGTHGQDNGAQANANEDAATSFGQGQSGLSMTGQTSSPGQNAQNHSFNNNANFGQTGSEQNIHSNNVGASFGVQNRGYVSGNKASISKKAFFRQFNRKQTVLAFSFDWPGSSDLDVVVFDPLGNQLCVNKSANTQCVQTTLQGGRVSKDHLGFNTNTGKSGGFETVFWTGKNIPNGDYQYGIRYFNDFSGSEVKPAASFKGQVTFKPKFGKPKVVDTFQGTLNGPGDQAFRTINVKPSDAP